MNFSFKSLFSRSTPIVPSPPSPTLAHSVPISTSTTTNPITPASPSPVAHYYDNEIDQDIQFYLGNQSEEPIGADYEHKYVKSEQCRIATWSPNIALFTDPDLPPTSTKKYHDPIASVPFLYRVLVLDFFTNLSIYTSLPLVDLVHMDVFTTTIPSGMNLLSSNSFDHWFVSCCKKPFLIERAWSCLVSQTFYSHYSHLILCQNTMARHRFAELCSFMYQEIKINTFDWRFHRSNGDINVSTINKIEIREHEREKDNLIHFFYTQNSILFTTEVDYQSIAVFPNRLFPDLTSTQYQHQLSLLTSQRVSSITNRALSFYALDDIKLLALEQDATNEPTATRMQFKVDEIGVAFRIAEMTTSSRTYSFGNTKAANPVDLTPLIANAYSRVLLAAAVGIRYHIRTKFNTLSHTAPSMRDRLTHSLSDIQRRLAMFHKQLTGDPNRLPSPLSFKLSLVR